MPRLTDFLQGYPPFERLADEASSLVRVPVAGVKGGDAGAFGVPAFAQAFVVAGLLKRSPWRESVVLLVVPSPESASDLEHDLEWYLPGRSVTFLPARGVWYGSEAAVQPRVAGRRARAVEALVSPGVGSVVLVEAATLMEGVVRPHVSPLVLAKGARCEFEGLSRSLVDMGYTRVEQVEDAGDFAVRGGIVDVFPSTEAHPVRIEFWGDEIESLRSFSVYSQRSLGPLEEVVLHPSAEEAEGGLVPVLSLLPDRATVLRVDERLAAARVESFQNDLADVRGDGGVGDGYCAWSEVQEQLARRPVVDISSFGLTAGDEDRASIRASSGRLAVTDLREAEDAVRRLVRQDYRVIVAFEHRAEAERAVYAARGLGGKVVGEADLSDTAGVSFVALPLRGHFVLPDLRLAVLPDSLIFPRRKKGVRQRPSVGAALSSFRDLRKGDYVVHEDHGIGRFEGLSTKTVAGVTRDYIDLAFRGKDMLYVPHDQIDKVMRYVGAGGAEPGLSKLGGTAWENLKSRVRKAARQVAGELLQLYALRQASAGYRFGEDGEWQSRFEQTFPYEETEDQLRAVDVIKDDMESERPMDRLLCGDVGYGKTEVALRAAFKATADGKQVMVLVPTTILAQQHYGTFRERFSEFPVKVEMISRFRTASEQKRILADLAAGTIDVVVGTHRLLSDDVRPKDLGLVIVDEEQRFGVSQKEALRRMKVKVDVLTLTATPIPRTLQMSLSGVRDVSIIETPPRDRHPIQTYVGVYDEGMVTRAIGREVDRGGQVFYLHNRVETIGRTVEHLRTLMPETRFAVAHGQMPEQELERVMLRFLQGESDVLVTTTIIESGLDIPNANTLIVERAELLGLAQLYQIRGRIGRSARVAHAFLFHPEDAALTEEAAARLSTLADYTELGSGFKIAMRDLEIRGAGELLGEEQSGHIAAVGFEMYLSMLEQVTTELRGEGTTVEKIPRVDIGIDAHVPTTFIGYEAARVDLHRRIASARKLEELAELRAELADRFGEIPEPVDNLVFLGEVRVRLQELGVDGIGVRPERVTVTGLALPSGSRERLRERDRRYVYAPLQGRLTLGTRGDDRGARETVEGLLSDILALFEGEEVPVSSK